MPKAEYKDKVEAHIDREKMKVLKELSVKENRTLKNYVENILLKHIDKYGKPKSS